MPNDLSCTHYSESNFACCLDGNKSMIGYAFMLVGAILWKSVKQSLTTTSTMEVKYVVCYEATRESV